MTAMRAHVPRLADARASVAAWGRRLQLAAFALAAAYGVGLALAAAALARLAGLPSVATWGVAGAVAAVASLVTWQRAAVAGLSPQRAALWLEEHTPSLRYALVTAVDGEAAATGVSVAPAAALALDHALDLVTREGGWEAPAWRALRQSLVRPALALVAGLALFALAPAMRRAHAGASGTSGGVPPEDGATPALGIVRVTVHPPRYVARGDQRLDAPPLVRAYPGSDVTVEGDGPARATRATLSDRTLEMAGDGTRWRVTLKTDSARALLRVERGGREARLIALEPLTDSAPDVTLRAPARDTILRAAEGTIPLRADLRDDLALSSAAFEYIVSSGEGERFTFKSGTIGTLPSGSARDATLRGTLSLAALGLAPGDVIHLRAVARDRNDVSGPGVGSSETRTIRIARAGEYDSVAVEQAPPPDADTSVISQRMLINLTEALLKRAPRLAAADVVLESRRIGRDQARLRKQVSDIVFSRLGDAPDGEHFHGDGHGHADTEALGDAPLTPEQLLKAAERATQVAGNATDFEHDETPVVAINRPMLEAYNAMWDAGRALDGGEPRRALKPMYVALAAIQRARAAERLYLRGAPPRVVVDLARVRLTGKDKGDPAGRTPRLALASPRGPLLQRFARAVDLLPRDAGAAVDSLIVLRLAVAGERAQAASALEGAIGDLRASRDATAALLRARRALDDAMVATDSLPAWGGH